MAVNAAFHKAIADGLVGPPSPKAVMDNLTAEFGDYVCGGCAPNLTDGIEKRCGQKFQESGSDEGGLCSRASTISYVVPDDKKGNRPVLGNPLDAPQWEA